MYQKDLTRIQRLRHARQIYLFQFGTSEIVSKVLSIKVHPADQRSIVKMINKYLENKKVKPKTCFAFKKVKLHLKRSIASDVLPINSLDLTFIY